MLLSDKEVLAELDKVTGLINGNGRALLRKSGTEPVIRIMIESEKEELCKEYAAMIAEVIEKNGYVVSR